MERDDNHLNPRWKIARDAIQSNRIGQLWLICIHLVNTLWPIQQGNGRMVVVAEESSVLP